MNKSFAPAAYGPMTHQAVMGLAAVTSWNPVVVYETEAGWFLTYATPETIAQVASQVSSQPGTLVTMSLTATHPNAAVAA